MKKDNESRKRPRRRRRRRAKAAVPANQQWALETPEEARIAADFLPQERIREIARRTGLIKRERSIDPVAMLWVLILGYGVSLQRHLAALRREYVRRTSTEIVDSSFQERFTPELVAFLQECAVLAIERLGAEAQGRLGERLKRFKDLMIVDGTVIRLHEKLAKKFPATRARKTAAGVKLSLLISAVANGPKKVAIAGERTPDVHMLRVGPWVKDCILLLDLGYFKYQLFARIMENGGFFVSRLKDSANPVVLGSYTNHRGRAIDVSGKKWQEVLPLLRRGVFDGKIEIRVPRRRYRGRQSTDTKSVRLVAVWNEEVRKYHAYITNLGPDVLTGKEVADLYSCRWDVELTFKELKSRYALDKIPSKNEYVVKALIWTAILTLLVSRRVYNFVRSRAPERMRVRYTQLRWATLFNEEASALLIHVLLYLRIIRSPAEMLPLRLGVYTSPAIDPHVERDRLKDGWVA